METPDFRHLLEDIIHKDNCGLHIYEPGNTTQDKWLSYRDLQAICKRNARRIRCIQGFKPQSIFLLHFDNHLDNIIWFWSVAYANCVPTMSTPFVKSVDGRRAHIQHLYKLLDDPICLTRKVLIRRDFADNSCLRVTCVDTLDEQEAPSEDESATSPRPDNLALLMLTSGSTGNAKAVCLTHRNLLASVRGKAAELQTHSGSVLLNFIGMDHVAALVETHLHALHIGASQVHIQATDLVSDPLEFIRLADKHRLCGTFAPNFFLAKLRRAMEAEEARLDNEKPDLSCLTRIVSGGEANLTETADALSKLLVRFGAPRNSIVIAWGMTETCAGSIYNLSCPEYDLHMEYEFASVGKCCPGIEMRVKATKSEHQDAYNSSFPNGTGMNGTSLNQSDVREVNSDRQNNAVSLVDENNTNYHTAGLIVANGSKFVGTLEVKGDIVFERYYNNSLTTKTSFSEDGWFNTEDLAIIDDAGHLNIVGRTKDTMTVNGIKYLPHEIEFAIDEAGIEGVTPSFIACFSRRLSGAPTEHICVLYLPSYHPENTQARMTALDGITNIVALQTSTKPYVLPLDESCLQKTTLGKLQRNKLKASLDQGRFANFEKTNEAAVKAFRKAHYSPPTTPAEARVLRIFQDVLDLQDGELGVDTPYFDAGLTSIDLIKIKRQLEILFATPEEIPMIVVMTKSTIRALAEAMESLASTEARPYSPVVTLNHTGHKTPLFLIHPGIGEILVFFGLVKFLDDRPVHAIRARGFNKGEPLFSSLTEVIETYYKAVRTTQSHGPYAIAGYSWGSMVAFELAKRLEADGEQVGFLGAFNLPPHIKWRMRQFDWVECVVHLAYFSDLITEESTSEVAPHMRTLPSKKAQLDYLTSISNPERYEELALSSASLQNWADVAYSLQSSAVDYEPNGQVTKMDIFFCRPLKILGITKQQWREEYLSAWEGFVNEVKYHEVDGAHYTMLLPEHVGSFQRCLKNVLKMRGV